MKNELFDFTKGKWKYTELFDENNNSVGYDVYVSFKPLIAESIRNEANARLISCAPEMLKALIEYVKNANMFPDASYRKNAISIIEKATGKKWEDVCK